MPYKLLRWIVWIAGVLILLLATASAIIFYYVNNNRDRVIQQAANAAGLEVAYACMEVNWWRDFPEVSVVVDSLVLRDTSTAIAAPPLLSFQQASARLSLSAILRDTIRLQNLTLANGTIHTERDASGRFNAGSLFAEQEPKDIYTIQTSGYVPVLVWAGLQLTVKNVSVTHLDSLKKKHLNFHLHQLFATGNTAENGNDLLLATEIDAYVTALALNTDKGSYLKHTTVCGPVSAQMGTDTITIFPATLNIGAQWFDVAANIGRGERTSCIYLSGNEVDYDLTRPILHDELSKKLADFHVAGTFPVAAEIIIDPNEPHDPEIQLNFALNGQDVRLKQYQFTNVTAQSCHIVNRLTLAQGGLADSKKNVHLELEKVRGYLGDILIETPHATLGSIPGSTKLTAPLHLAGPAASLGNQLENRDFLFKQGNFTLKTNVNASLDFMDELISSSDGELLLENVDVWYRPANATLPFERIELKKAGHDIAFRIHSKPLPNNFSFQLHGTIDNLAPLLLDRPGEALSSDVTLVSPRINWTDFLAFFGTDGYFNDAQDTTSIQPQASMRKTLLGLKQAFHPRVQASFDTVAYYDIFAVTDFSTGLHFLQDTLVLEQTSFNWAGSQLGMDARLDLSQANQTPFRLNAQADHLNLNALRPSLDYFGLQLPTELESLPDDLSIQFAHQGILDDSSGIVPGHNSGQLVFDDGKNGLFSGNLHYAPGPRDLESFFHLAGDPQIVNTLFGAENFFFGTGHFSLDLNLEGSPNNLTQLIRTGKLRLLIDSTRIRYQPADVYIPVRSFAVKVEQEQAEFKLHLITDATNRSVLLDGTLDHLAAFLAPEKGQRFKVDANLTAPMLAWSDLSEFVFSETADTNQREFNPQTFFSATEGAFRSFRPNLRLDIDTFLVKDTALLTAISAHLHLSDSLGLLLNQCGFKLGDGSVRLNARYALDEVQHSPFNVDWEIDNLDLRHLVSQAASMDLPLPEDLHNLTGQLTMNGSLAGQLDESNQHLLLESTHGTMSFQFSNLAVANSPFLHGIGRKTKMKKRFQLLRFAPLAGEIRIDSGLVTIPRLEVQNTGMQLFIEGNYNLQTGPDLLISLPLRNIGRGLMHEPPPLTGYARSGWRVYLELTTTDKQNEPSTKFRLGRRGYYKKRGRLDEFKEEKKRLRQQRKTEARLRNVD